MNLMNLIDVMSAEHMRVWDSAYNLVWDCDKDAVGLLEKYGSAKIHSIEPDTDDYCINIYLKTA